VEAEMRCPVADDAKRIDPAWAWSAYEPTKAEPWDVRKVGHLYRRAAFGANAAELARGVADGPAKAVARLLAGEPDGGFEGRTAAVADVIRRTNNAGNLRAWWLTRMLYSPHPLREKMTLFWHNHFATSNAKVQNAGLMLGQYGLMHAHALGSFAEMLRRMSTDPAMLIWLDGRGSRKGSPNENYARELMELFSLGIGPYTEKDVREAARAFTGYDLDGPAAAFTAANHDAGTKTVMGRTGAWKPDDVVKICLDQPACANFLCTKLFRFLVSETAAPAKELIAPLSKQLRATGYDVGAVVKTVVSSNLFFSGHAYRARVKSPVDFALGVVRGLEGRIGTTALGLELEKLGQNLFHPPSVKGWDGGPTWLNGQTLLYRQNLALAFTSTEDGRFGTRLDPAAVAAKHGKAADDELVTFFLTLFLQDDVPAESRSRLREYAASSRKVKTPVFWTARDAAEQRVRSLCHLVLTLPECQLD
ncbi:MAG: DUF1800 domain-containing protein, partial [Gemmataceae bacterium]